MMETTRQDVTAAKPLPNEHHHVWALLPWIANGSANPEQQTRALIHLEHCDDCRVELKAQRQLQQALQTEAPTVSVAAEQGLQRLLGRIDTPLREQPMPTTQPQRKRSPLLVAMAAMIAMQAIGLGVLSVGQRHGDDAEFRMLSQPEIAPKAGTLRVMPADSMTMAEWDALLQSLGLRMVDGPNTVGVYTLAPAAAGATSTTEQLAHLRKAPNIRLAEAITP